MQDGKGTITVDTVSRFSARVFWSMDVYSLWFQKGFVHPVRFAAAILHRNLLGSSKGVQLLLIEGSLKFKIWFSSAPG